MNQKVNRPYRQSVDAGFDIAVDIAVDKVIKVSEVTKLLDDIQETNTDMIVDSKIIRFLQRLEEISSF